MNQLNKFAIVAALIVAFAFVAIAVEEKEPEKDRVLTIKSQGQVVAELHLKVPGKFLADGCTMSVSPNGHVKYSSTEEGISGVWLLNDPKVALRLTGNVEFEGTLDDLGIKQIEK